MRYCAALCWSSSRSTWKRYPPLLRFRRARSDYVAINGSSAVFLYIAGNLQVEMLEKIADRAGANHFLCSFADPSARKAAKYFCVQPHRRVFVDSGAYSAWTKGKPIK